MSYCLDSLQGCLALAIFFDQFPLNMFRGVAESFTAESAAIDVVLHAVKNSFDQEISLNQIIFLYMPSMHSENIKHRYFSVEKNFSNWVLSPGYHQAHWPIPSSYAVPGRKALLLKLAISILWMLLKAELSAEQGAV